MTGNYSARLTGSKRNLLVLLASSAVFSAGCANMTTTAPASNPLGSAATLSGRIHGGNQPVSGAAVTLWYAGQSRRCSLKRPRRPPTVNGNFSFVKDANHRRYDYGQHVLLPRDVTDPAGLCRWPRRQYAAVKSVADQQCRCFHRTVRPLLKAECL